MSLRLLGVGDIHLGRRPSRLPEGLAADARDLGPAGAWERVVGHAILNEVDVVALAGDVVEREDDFYEAYRELSRGVKKLVDAGIRVVGVAGNHDVHVLPRLADQLPEFELIGRGGQWEASRLEAGGEVVTLHGWSFREARVRTSPLENIRLERGEGPNLGLLHCDRDQSGSHHAPVMSRELDNAGLDGWMLGHIHAPDRLDGDQLSGYLGCISGMDPGEPGDHGPWLIQVSRGRIEAVTQWVLAPLRWDALPLDVSELTEPEDARTELLDALRNYDNRLTDTTIPPKAVGIRLRLTGRTRFGGQVQQLLAQDQHSVVFEGDSGAHYFIERCLGETRPEISLQKLAERNDPAGLLARRLLALEQPQEEQAQRLISEGRQIFEDRLRDSRWEPLQEKLLDDAAVADYLQRAGTRLLEDMLDQVPEVSE